jgi:hypothetical protein
MRVLSNSDASFCFSIKCGLLSAKGGLMMGTKKVGAFSSPRKKANIIIAKKNEL